MAWWAAWHMHMHADFTSTSELPFASLERVLVLNVSHENDLIFMRMNVQVTYIFIPIVSHIDSFCHRGKSKLGIGLFIRELLREPLIILIRHKRRHIYICLQFYSSKARLDFLRSLVSGLPSPRRSSGEDRGLLPRTAAGNRASSIACFVCKPEHFEISGYRNA